MSELESIARELDAAAARLREDGIDPDEAADLVERCADLAQRISAEIDARTRSAGEAEGQEHLL